MPVQIGASAHNFNDPTGLLSDCHRRVEMFLGTLEAVAKVIDEPANEERRRALRSALRYFAEAAPKHTADEEESLFPRLRQMHNREVESALGRLDGLENDHRWASPLHEEIERLGEQYLSTGRLSTQEVETFRNSIASLASMYKQHISVEDSMIFPLAKRVLSDTQKSAIAREMASRRQVKLMMDLS